MKKTVSLLLALFLIVGMLAGCGGSDTAASASVSEASAPVEESAAAAAPEAPEEPAQEPSVEEPASVAEEVVEEEPVYEVTYPLTEEPVTLSLMHSEPMLGPLSGRCGVDSYGDVAGVQKVAEATGVSIEWNEVSMMTASEQFNLVVASGDYPDMLSGVTSYYAGGQTKAYEDEVIIGLDEYVAEFAPDYYAAIKADAELYRQTKDDDGHTLGIYAIYDEAIYNEGALVRKDWLEDVGMDVPTTFEELTAAMTAIQSEKGVANPIYFNERMDFLSYGYNIKGFDMSGSTIPIYQVDGQVRCSFIEEDYKAYITLLNKWYQTGLINPNFLEFSSDLMSGEVEVELNANRIAIWSGMVTSMTNYYAGAQDASFDVVPVIITQDGGKDHVTLAARSQDSICITTACEDVELALGWINYWFTEDGTMLYNYGVEGDTYVLENGSPVYTDKVMNNELGVDATLFCRTFSLAGCSFGFTLQERVYQLYEDYQTEAQLFWTENTDGIYGVPTLAMTTEESDILATYGTDITTYASETLPKFVMGEIPLDQWDDYVETLKGMNIDEIIGAYQAAYDRYLLR